MRDYSNEFSIVPTYMNDQKYNCLTVLCFDHKDKTQGNIWKCKCDCGNIVYVSTKKLRSGRTKSCGCLHDKAAGERNFKDLTGWQFGLLTVIRRAESVVHKKALWLCQCECGATKVIRSSDLVSGKIKSCGCIKSVGERTIKQVLNQMNIRYIHEYSFSQCRDKKPLRFDFYLPDIGPCGACIEFDGIQHYQDSGLFTREVPLNKLQERDRTKTEYCHNNHINLLRIPYWEKDNIESILKNWLVLSCAEDADASSVNIFV